MQPDLSAVHQLLDTPQSAEDIEQAIVKELYTVQDVVRYCVSCFSAHHIFVGHGTDNYWDEALEIVQAVMHLQPPCDESTLSSRLTLSERRLIAKLITLRIFKRLPVPYLTHRAFFCGHQFYVDDRVIIPRSPIAELIEQGFSPYLDRNPERVLDMCTGSGCIAIAIALHFDEDTQVDAVDISPEALEVANINIEGYGLENQVTPILSDLFAALPKGDKYDLIVANPPYVDERDLNEMPEEYRAEPALSLGSGRDGLDCARRILAQASDYLNDDGVLIMEVGNSAEALNDAFPQVPFHFIDLKKGGTGVFLLGAEQLKAYTDLFKAAAKEAEHGC
ncbi:MAG: 50S ribosomal protein L3 N(5)-glutamine methyltransferase [Proteobacteria bacterium]|uniref:50S ribosomal protein L3 N(5)-glutamine methyltransferase n=1 Tax=Candidatus Avisuccinivibrio stercorigallinarum TaxID=2840704 RepID=A0A9D9D9D8_9GAMM|nr:50S ribosomal protein L3 N(5)-glutamine methyltransferase [Candidatus Avisuccinivibrio stercorigallinarum]